MKCAPNKNDNLGAKIKGEKQCLCIRLLKNAVPLKPNALF